MCDRRRGTSWTAPADVHGKSADVVQRMLRSPALRSHTFETLLRSRFSWSRFFCSSC